jgi:hypothetical protein
MGVIGAVQRGYRKGTGKREYMGGGLNWSRQQGASWSAMGSHGDPAGIEGFIRFIQVTGSVSATLGSIYSGAYRRTYHGQAGDGLMGKEGFEGKVCW